MLIKVNISLIENHIIRGPKSISISSHFFVLPLWVMKNEFYIAELRILWMERIAVIL